MLLQILLRTRLSKPGESREGFSLVRDVSSRGHPRGVALDSAKDQAELREAPRPREGSFRAKLSLPPRQSAHGMTPVPQLPFSCIKQSIKLHQAKEASGLAISAIKRAHARRTSPWAAPRTSAAPTTAQVGRWLFCNP